MKKNNLLSGALILSFGGVLAKVFSAIYRIVLTRILGGVGIGLYQLIFPFYSLCVVLATAGLPMAISKVVSKHKDREWGVVKKCFLFTTIISLILSFVLFVSAKGLAFLQGQKQLTICYLILSPTIIVVTASSVLRGYFQGKHNFIPSTISNICEQFVKMIVGLILCLCLVGVSLFAGIIGSVVGIIVSEIASLIILVVFIKKEKNKSNTRSTVKIKDLVKDVLPITLTNIVLPIASFIDSVLVVNLLANNFSNDISVFLYGLESGAVSSLVTIPTIFSFALSSVVLPKITNSKHPLDRNNKLAFALKLVFIITIPCVLAFILVPNRLIEVLYQSKLDAYGLNGANIASKLLAISSLGVVFLAINQICSSALQAVDERYVAIRNLIIAIVLKFVFEIVLMPHKLFNIYALALSNTICYCVVMVLNQLEVKANYKMRLSYSFWAKLILSNCVMVVSLVVIMALGGGVFNTIISIIISVTAYLISLIKTRIFTSKDRAMLKYKV